MIVAAEPIAKVNIVWRSCAKSVVDPSVLRTDLQQQRRPDPATQRNHYGRHSLDNELEKPITSNDKAGSGQCIKED